MVNSLSFAHVWDTILDAGGGGRGRGHLLCHTKCQITQRRSLPFRLKEVGRECKMLQLSHGGSCWAGQAGCPQGLVGSHAGLSELVLPSLRQVNPNEMLWLLRWGGLNTHSPRTKSHAHLALNNTYHLFNRDKAFNSTTRSGT